MNGGRWKVVVCCMLVPVSWVKAEHNPSDYEHATVQHNKMTISGTRKFTRQVVKCLDLLVEQAPSEYDFISQYMGAIKQHHTSGMNAAADPPTFEMSSKTAFASLTWCASSIAHDAYHAYLYQQHQPENGGPTATRHWAGVKAESLSILHQRTVAEMIDSPANEIDYLYRLKGTHADLNGDGQITHEDENKRDW